MTQRFKILQTKVRPPRLITEVEAKTEQEALDVFARGRGYKSYSSARPFGDYGTIKAETV